MRIILISFRQKIKFMIYIVNSSISVPFQFFKSSFSFSVQPHQPNIESKESFNLLCSCIIEHSEYSPGLLSLQTVSYHMQLSEKIYLYAVDCCYSLFITYYLVEQPTKENLVL